MFHNTAGGDYQDNGSVVYYTFPKDAVFEINNVIIPIAGIMLKCFGGKLDPESLKHFTKIASLLSSKTPEIYNTSIYINDNEIGGNGYPSRDDFVKHGVDYLSPEEFIDYQDKVRYKKISNYILKNIVAFFTQWSWSADNLKLNKLVTFLIQWSADHRKRISKEIHKIVNENTQFPKNLSIIYVTSSFKFKHATHIVLSFETSNKCVLHIDNSLSPSSTFCSQALLNLEFDIDEYSERILDDQSKFIELYKKNGRNQESFIKLALLEPVNQLFIRYFYQDMIKVLSLLDLQITDVKVHHSYNSQKKTDECVSYAIQNKLTYITNSNDQYNETARQRGIRLRAEHAILSYLLNGDILIPRFNDQNAKDCGCKYEDGCWYPNFEDVCKKIEGAIKSLSFNDLNKLYLSTEIDDTNKLSTKFSDLILSAMKDKLPNDEYKQIVSSDFSQTRAIFMEKTMAPGIFYNKDKQSLFVSRLLMFSMKTIQEEKGMKHAIENDIEQQLVKFAFS